MYYTQFVQEMVFDCDRLYRKVGYMRDAASPEEKDFYNKARGQLSQVYATLGALYDMIPEERAAMPVEPFK